MAKYITMTENMKKALMEDFEKSLSGLKMQDGKIEYRRSFPDAQGKATVIFTPKAYFKMMKLVNEYTTEVAWHGVVQRDAEDPTKFTIEDIMVYPQTVTSGNVETDQAEYQTWLYSEEIDPVFNRVRMQGHSHASFACTPSAVDLQHQDGILAQCQDTFYIFIIWNRRDEHWAAIYDVPNNIKYESKDITVTVDLGFDMDSFIKDSHTKVKEKTYAYQGYPYNHPGFALPTQNTPAKQKEEPKNAAAPAAKKPEEVKAKTKVPRYDQNGWWDSNGKHHDYFD